MCLCCRNLSYFADCQGLCRGLGNSLAGHSVSWSVSQGGTRPPDAQTPPPPTHTHPRGPPLTRVFSAQRRPAHLLPPLLLPSGRVTPGWLGTRHSPLGRGQPAVTAEWGLLRSVRWCARTHVLQAGPAGPSGHQRCPVPADASPGRVCQHKLAHVVESGVELPGLSSRLRARCSLFPLEIILWERQTSLWVLLSES